MPKKRASEATVDIERVARWRAARHFLAGAKGTDAVAVARRVCGVHAQLGASAVLATRLRAPVDHDAVDRALLHDRTLVKTWAARGTLHLLPAADLPAWVAALSTPARRATATWPPPDGGVTAQEMADLLAALPAALGSDILTRRELADRLVVRTGHENLRTVLTQSWGAVLKPAAFLGMLCFGPPRGRNVTFVAPSAWLPDFSVVDTSPDEAVESLALEYLDAYGPADIVQFCHWCGLGGPRFRRAFDRLGDRLAYVDVDGSTWAIRRERLPELLDPPADTGIRLLPAFDPYVVGSLRQLDRLVVGGASNVRQVSRPQGWISPVVVVNGRIAGIWSRDGDRIDVTPFKPLPRTARAGLRAATQEITALWAPDSGVPA